MGIESRNVGPGGIAAGKITGALNADPWSRTLYVSSTHQRAVDSGNHGLDKYHPLATLRQAVALAQVDDRIIVRAGHVENVSKVMTINVVGLKIIGLGKGTRRPKFTFDTSATESRIHVTAAGGHIENLHFTAGIDSLSRVLQYAADDQDLIDCLVTHDATYQIVDAIQISDSNNIRIIRLQAQQAAAGAGSCILGTTPSNLEIHGCHITGDYSTGCIEAGVAVQVLIADNWLESVNAADNCITLAATASGRISNNKCRIATDGQTTWITAADCDWYENYGVNLDGETGKLIGTVSV